MSPKTKRRKVNMRWILPPDYTKEEKKIMEFCILSIYNQFNDPVDKLIIMGVYELGYDQKTIAEMVGRQPQAIGLRIKKIKTILSKSHKRYLKP